VPKEVLYDNMKTVIVERNAYGRGVHRFHAGFLDYAKHTGFLPRLCHPYRAQTTDEVEQPFFCALHAILEAPTGDRAAKSRA
jgi:transposase